MKKLQAIRGIRDVFGEDIKTSSFLKFILITPKKNEKGKFIYVRFVAALACLFFFSILLVLDYYLNNLQSL